MCVCSSRFPCVGTELEPAADIPEGVRGAVGDALWVEPVGPLTLKRLHRPVARYNVIGLDQRSALTGCLGAAVQ